MDHYKKVITFKVTPEEYKAITDRAWQVRRSRSEYLRGFINALRTDHELRRQIENKLEVNK